MNAKFTILLITVFFFVACGGGGSSSGSGSESADTEVRFNSTCGAIRDTENTLDVNLNDLEQVNIDAVTPDTIIVTRSSGTKADNQQLVKLLGVSSNAVSPKALTRGIELVNKLGRPQAYFLPAHEETDEYIDSTGARGVYAQLISANGQSIAEELVIDGSAKASINGLFSDQLFDCYNNLQVEADTSESFTTQCGVVSAGELKNPISLSELDLVSIEVLAPDFMVGTFVEGSLAGQTIGIKLHGVSSENVSDFLISEGMNRVNELVAGNAYLLRAGQGCIYTSSTGGQAELAQVFSLAGVNVSEELISLGAVVPDNNGCSANSFTDCYSGIEVDSPEPPKPETPSGDEGDPNSFPDTEIDDFLWKPVSESTGNLVILVNVFDVRVRVIGSVTEDLVNTGPSNGRGTTARASRRGCAFGRDITVQFFNAAGERILLKDGRRSVQISNGCNRVEFKL